MQTKSSAIGFRVSSLSVGCCDLIQVSHHPPAAAHHVISDRGWTLRQEITVASKFRGKYLSIMPLGKSRAAATVITAL